MINPSRIAALWLTAIPKLSHVKNARPLCPIYTECVKMFQALEMSVDITDVTRGRPRGWLAAQTGNLDRMMQAPARFSWAIERRGAFSAAKGQYLVILRQLRIQECKQYSRFLY